MTLYWVANGAMATTAPSVAVALTTGTHTHLQLATSSTRKVRVVKWGVQCSSTPTVPLTCELIETNTAATMATAHLTAGIQPYSDSGAGVSSLQTGTTALTGWGLASGEGSPTTSRYADLQVLQAGQSSFEWEWSLGREFDVAVSRFLRIRTTTSVAISATLWVIVDD